MISLADSLDRALPPVLGQIPATVGCYLHDLHSGHRFSAGGEDLFPAASVIKILILMEAYRRAAAGELSLEARIRLEEEHLVGGAGVLLELHAGLELTVEDLCRLMIVVSDNTASNLLLDLVGEDSVNALCRQLGLTRTRLGRRFMETPTGERENTMSPCDAVRCLEVLWRSELLDAEWSHRALEILRRQQYREKIPRMLPEELPVAHKTGELEGVRHDAALVESSPGPYLLAVFTRDGGDPWEVDLGIARLSRLCHDLLTGVRA
ncbi:MAG: serine hydrolase [Armatimonadetes bacterium]|nr:serine hydrolase [Armatimonadota bacterium]